MTPFLKGDPGRTYEFSPPDRVDAIEKLFVAMMESLGPGDEYHTLSTLPFWLSFKDSGRDFLEACGMAMQERHVVIKRILVVPDALLEPERMVIRNHRSLRDTVGAERYQLKIVRESRKKALQPKGHIGICYRKAELITAFHVGYDNGTPPRVATIRLRADAKDAIREFHDTWSKAGLMDQELPGK